MILTKKEAKARNLERRICAFHNVNPDQEGVYHCTNCVIIQDPCGCDEDMECEDCALDKEEFLKDMAERGIFPRKKEAWEEA